jgi:hypothetical protein
VWFQPVNAGVAIGETWLVHSCFGAGVSWVRTNQVSVCSRPNLAPQKHAQGFTHFSLERPNPVRRSLIGIDKKGPSGCSDLGFIITARR